MLDFNGRFKGALHVNRQNTLREDPEVKSSNGSQWTPSTDSPSHSGWGSTTGLVGGAALSNAGVIGYGDDDEYSQPAAEATSAGYDAGRSPDGNAEPTEDLGFEGHHAQPSLMKDYTTRRLHESDL